MKITVSLLPSVAIHARDLQVQSRVYACCDAILDGTFYLKYYFYYIIEELKQIDLQEDSLWPSTVNLLIQSKNDHAILMFIQNIGFTEFLNT